MMTRVNWLLFPNFSKLNGCQVLFLGLKCLQSSCSNDTETIETYSKIEYLDDNSATRLGWEFPCAILPAIYSYTYLWELQNPSVPN